jgi:hypothetical protein
MSTKTAKPKTTQKQFFEALAARAKTYGFTQEPVSYGTLSNIREKRTGTCPVVAVARKLGQRKTVRDDHIAAAKAIGLDLKFARKVAQAADTIDQYPPLRRRLLRCVGIKAAA